MKKNPDHNPIIILGAGGHAKVVIDVLLLAKADILGIVETDPSLVNKKILGIPVLGLEDIVYRYAPQTVRLINGLGGARSTALRKGLYEKFTKTGYSFAGIVHPSAVIGQEVTLSEGVQIMAGAVIQPGTIIGRNSIVNTRASVDHDCRIGDHVHISPGATICGGVSIEDDVFIGSGAVVVPGTIVNEGTFIRAGSLVTARGTYDYGHTAKIG